MFDETFRDFAQDAAALPRAAFAAARRDEADFQHRGVDDGADVQPVLLGDARIGDAQQAIARRLQFREPIVGFECVAAGRHELDGAVELAPREAGIGQRRSHFGEKRVGIERRLTRHAEDVLREHVEAAGTCKDGVLRAGFGGLLRGPALEHLETVARHQDAARWLVEAMVGAADTLQKSARAFRCAEVNDKIDIAPVDAEVERRRRDDGAQLAGGHRGFDLFALSGIERAVMQADRQIVIVGAPEFLEGEFGLHAGVDEDERQFLRADGIIDFAHGVARGVTRPRDVVLGFEDADFGFGAARNGDDVGEQRHRFGFRLGDEIAAQFAWACDGCREPDRHYVGRELAQPREIERQKIAALRRRRAHAIRRG